MPKVVPYVLAVVCMLAYAFIIVELKPLTRQYNIIVLAASYLPLQLLYTGAALGVVWLVEYRRGMTLAHPHGRAWWFIAAFALAYFVAQNLNTAVYATGGTPQLMSYMALLIPLFVPLLSYFFRDGRLNLWHGVAFIAAVAMVLASIKADSS